MDRKNRSNRFTDEEDRKHSQEGLRADSSRRRPERDRHDQESIRVPKKREEVHVERIPAEEGRAPEEVEVRDDEILIPVIEEEVVVEKRPVVKEVLRVRKDVLEEEEPVGIDVPEKDKDKHRYLNEGAQIRDSGERNRRAASGREEARGRRDSNQDDRSFLDKAKDALSGEDMRGREGTGTRGEAPRGTREEEPPRRRR